MEEPIYCRCCFLHCICPKTYQISPTIFFNTTQKPQWRKLRDHWAETVSLLLFKGALPTSQVLPAKEEAPLLLSTLLVWQLVLVTLPLFMHWHCSHLDRPYLLGDPTSPVLNSCVDLQVIGTRLEVFGPATYQAVRLSVTPPYLHAAG